MVQTMMAMMMMMMVLLMMKMRMTEELRYHTSYALPSRRKHAEVSVVGT